MAAGAPNPAHFAIGSADAALKIPIAMGRRRLAETPVHLRVHPAEYVRGTYRMSRSAPTFAYPNMRVSQRASRFMVLQGKFPRAGMARFHSKVQSGLARSQALLRLLALVTSARNGHVLTGLSVLVEERHDGRVHPIKGTVFGLVFNFAFPNLPMCDSRPDVPDKIFGMPARIDNAMIWPSSS